MGSREHDRDAHPPESLIRKAHVGEPAGDRSSEPANSLLPGRPHVQTVPSLWQTGDLDACRRDVNNL